MTFRISSAAIDVAGLMQQLQDDRSGAAVFFEGRVRNHNDGRKVDSLEYEVYEPLAVKEGNGILQEAAQKWNIHEAFCVHRSGVLGLKDTAVLVGVLSSHRDEAFQAARFIIDESKVRLPIWKREFYSDGTVEWVNCQRCAEHAQQAI